MCGIAGQIRFSCDNKELKKGVEKMLSVLVHR